MPIYNKLKNTGQIFLHDVNKKSINAAKIRFKRIKGNNVQFHSDKKFLKKHKTFFDSVILDVPCSCTGVLKRNPEMKLFWDEAVFKNLIYKQKDILFEGKDYVKNGGYLYYFTCSLLKEENFNQIEKFLKIRKEFNLIESNTIFPEIDGGDGFFYAILQKNN